MLTRPPPTLLPMPAWQRVSAHAPHGVPHLLVFALPRRNRHADRAWLDIVESIGRHQIGAPTEHPALVADVLDEEVERPRVVERAPFLQGVTAWPNLQIELPLLPSS